MGWKMVTVLHGKCMHSAVGRVLCRDLSAHPQLALPSLLRCSGTAA